MSARITVLCVDDHPLMRDGIAFAIEQQDDIQLIGEASTGKEAILAYRRYKPYVTLMDLQMPDMDGIAATAAIIEEFPSARIIILTTYSGDIQATRALRVGAKGYLLKECCAPSLSTPSVKCMLDDITFQAQSPMKSRHTLA